MNNSSYIITQQELEEIGITPEEVEEAGGIEAIAHIIWFFQKTDNFSDEDIEEALANAIYKRKQEEILQKAFSDFIELVEHDTDDKTLEVIKKYPIPIAPLKLKTVFEDKTLTIKNIYEQNCGDNPHPALQLLLEAYFLDTQDIIPSNEDKKEILKTISLLRAYVAGSDLPSDAEEEKLITYARLLYKEFLETKDDYDKCPLKFLLDDYYDNVPEQYRMIALSLPVAAILRIFADNCFYDIQTAQVDEPLPEEINIKNLCEMIERLARIYKIWQ